MGAEQANGCGASKGGRRGWGALGWRAIAGGLALAACSVPGAPSVSPGDEAQEGAPPAGAPSSGAAPLEPSSWIFPEGGVTVAALSDTGNQLQAIDAFGNLWIRSCEGLFVANEREIRRYRYLDTPWEQGGGVAFADGQGRVWYSTTGRLSMLEQGQWREAPALGRVVVGSDGVAWAITGGERSGDSSMLAIWPEISPPISAPRWYSETFVGRNGELWYRTSVGRGGELWHFDGQRFVGPFPEVGFYFYDSLDDTLGIVQPDRGELIKVRYDGEAIVEVARSAVSWYRALGRQSEGYLIVQDHDLELLVLDGEQALPLPPLSRRLARGRLVGMLSPTGELYLRNDAGVFHYRDGELRSVIEYAPYAVPVHAWRSAGYGRALRAESVAATRADFEPEIPAIFGAKVQITGSAYYVGFEAPHALAVDGEPTDVAVAVEPELYALLGERGLDVQQGQTNEEGLFDPDAALWEMFGYLEPGPCYQPGEKTFHVVEAYPLAMPAAERAALGAELRERHPP